MTGGVEPHSLDVTAKLAPERGAPTHDTRPSPQVVEDLVDGVLVHDVEEVLPVDEATESASDEIEVGRGRLVRCIRLARHGSSITRRHRACGLPLRAPPRSRLEPRPHREKLAPHTRTSTARSIRRPRAGGRSRASKPREVKDRLARSHAPPGSPPRRGAPRRDGAILKSSYSEPIPALAPSKSPLHNAGTATHGPSPRHRRCQDYFNWLSLLPRRF